MKTVSSLFVLVLVALPLGAFGQNVHHHYHHTRSAPAARPLPRPVQVEPAPSHEDLFLLGLGIRVSGIALEGHKLYLSDIENPVMGGVGLHFRSKFSRHWGLELAADYLRGGKGDFTQVTIPVTLSALVYFFPDSRINPYGLFGAGVHFTALEYEKGLFRHDFVEFGGHLGAGVQVRIWRSLALHADLRFMGIYKNLSTASSIRRDCVSHVGPQRGFCDGLSSFDPDDRFNVGLQFQAGATYFF
jgi:hypothetical protein